MPGGELARMDPNAELEFDWRQAKALSASGLFPDARKAEQALAKIRFGRDLGMNATQAMTGIHIVEGKPQVAAVTLGAFVRLGAGGYDYRILEHDDEHCLIEFGPRPAPGRADDGTWQPWLQAFGTSGFSIDDARRAGLVKDKSGWAKYPRNMVFARAMSNGVKWFCPDAVQGIPVYHEGEIEPQHVIDGQVVSDADPAAEVPLSAAVADVPEDLRQRLYAAYGEAADLRSVSLSPAVVQMSVKGQPRERVEAFIETVERANAEARAAAQDAEIEDADVVEPEPEPAEGGLDLDDINRQLADLYELRQGVEENPGDEMETDAELERIGREVDRLERLRDSAQESLL